MRDRGIVFHQSFHAKVLFHSRLPAAMQYELGSNPAASNMWGVFKDNDASADVRERVAPGFGFWSINPGSHTAASPIRFTKYGASGVFGARPQNQGTRACPIKKSLFEVVFITLFYLFVIIFVVCLFDGSLSPF